MPLVEDLRGKAHKLNYVFSYLPILLTLGHNIIYLQFLLLVTHLGVTKPFHYHHNTGDFVNKIKLLGTKCGMVRFSFTIQSAIIGFFLRIENVMKCAMSWSKFELVNSNYIGWL